MRVGVMTEAEADRAQAHMINVVKTGGGFIRAGHHATLYCRPPLSDVTFDALAARYAEPDLQWRTPRGSMFPAHQTRAHEPTDAFTRWAVDEAQRDGVNFVYARSFRCALTAANAGLSVVCETHAYIDDPNPLLDAAIIATTRDTKRIAAIITISHRLRDHYIRRGADPDRVFIVPDGVDFDRFARPQSMCDADLDPFVRDQGHAASGRRVLYSGHLYDHKGIPTLIEAARLLDDDTRVHLLGGLPDDVARVRSRIAEQAPGRVIAHGPVPHAHVPPWLWHADVLVLPPSAREPSCNWTSPIKLAEYLAAGTPIVASAIPALRDWVDERAVEWFEPDDAADLARAIRAAMCESTVLAETRRAHAMAVARSFSYQNRARAILAAGGVIPPTTADASSNENDSHSTCTAA